MKTFILSVALALTVVALGQPLVARLLAQAQDAKVVKEELKSLQGRWKPVTAEQNGMEVDPKEDDWTLKFTGDKVVQLRNGKVHVEGKVEVADPTKTSKRAYWKYTNVAVNNSVLYFFVGRHTLVTCWNGEDEKIAEWPTGFATGSPGTGVYLVVWKRAQDEATGQEKTPRAKWEYQAVSFGSEEKENTKKLTDLAADGWEYVGPLAHNMVAFKRPLEPAGALRVIEGHTHVVLGVAISPDGTRLLSASEDDTVRLTEVRTGQLMRSMDHSSARSVVFSPDGKKAISTGWGRDRTLRLWDLETGKELKRFAGYPSGIHGAAFTPDGKQVLFCLPYDKTLRLLELETGKEAMRLVGHTEHVEGYALSADGKKTLSGSEDKTVRLWDNESGKELKRFEGHKDKVHCVALSPDGKRAASGGDEKLIKIWDLETGKEIRQLEGHTERVVGIAFSPDGRRIASACYDKTVRLWDAETGKELYKFEGHTRVVYAVAYSPDGRFLVSGSEDKTVRVWRLSR